MNDSVIGEPGVGYQVTIERTFSAPRELVFDALTQPRRAVLQQITVAPLRKDDE